MKSVIISRTLQSLAPRARIARVIVAVAFAGLFTAACSSSTDLRTVTSLTVTPTTATLAPGGVQQFTAVAKASNGSVLAVTPTWSVVAGGGTITQTGLFTAGTVAGTFTNTVSVTCSGITVTATVIVTGGPLFAITVAPDTTLVIGATAQFRAVGRDANGNVVAITPVWSVINPVASTLAGTIIPTTGLFTAGNTIGSFPNSAQACVGTICDQANVIVTVGPLLTITVTPNPATVQTNATQQFTAVGTDAGGNVVPITPVWSVTNGGGSINAGTGVFTAGTVTGTFDNTVRATQGTIFGTATVIVVSSPPPAPIVSLGTASTYGILAGSTATCVTGGLVKADIGISPGSALVGFAPGVCVLTGARHLADAAAAQAQLDLTAAYNILAGLPCGTNIVADLGGTTLTPGVYCSTSSIGVTGTLTLDALGDPNAVFVFQAGSTLTTAGMVLTNGAQAQNIYWQVGSSATIGVGSAWQGNILALQSITLVDGATLLGRALARNGAVTLGTNNVITLP